MDRKRFLKLFGLGVAVIATAKIVIDQTKKVDENKYIAGCDPYNKSSRSGIGIMKQIENQRNFIIYTGEKGQEAFNKAIKEYTNNYINII